MTAVIIEKVLYKRKQLPRFKAISEIEAWGRGVTGAVATDKFYMRPRANDVSGRSLARTEVGISQQPDPDQLGDVGGYMIHEAFHP